MADKFQELRDELYEANNPATSDWSFEWKTDDQFTVMEALGRIAELETQLAEKQSQLDELNGILGEAANTPAGAVIRNLEQQLAEKTAALQLAEEMIRAVKSSVVDTVGGTDYEGNPTSELNYLQRLRILVEKEDILEGGK